MYFPDKNETHKEKILVVDDDRDLCRMIASILKEEEYSVDKAYSAKGAIKKIVGKNYDLMIVDYRMPDMNGLEIIEEARMIKPALKIIMTSAYGSPSIKSRAKKSRIYIFLDKPFELNRLVKVVKGALTKKVRAILTAQGGAVLDSRADSLL